MTRRTSLRPFAFLTVLLAAATGRAQAPKDQETNLPGVTARLLSVHQQDNVLTVAIALRNSGSADATSSVPLDFSKFVLLVEGASDTTYSPLKDQNGHYLAGPISDWNDGGRWFPKIPSNGARTVWAMFGPLPAGVKATIKAPLLHPFDGVDIAAVAARPPAGEGIPHEALTGTVVSAIRANGQLKLRMKIARGASGFVETAGFKYADVSLMDPVTRRLYGLLKDQDGNYVAQPVSDKGEGGRFFLNSIPANGQIFMNLAFTLPPDTVRRALLLLPFLAPSEVEIPSTAGA